MKTKTINKKVKNIYFRVDKKDISKWEDIAYIGDVLRKIWPNNEEYWSIRNNKTIIMPESMAWEVFDKSTVMGDRLAKRNADTYIVVLILYTRGQISEVSTNSSLNLDKTRHMVDLTVEGGDMYEMRENSYPIPYSTFIFGLWEMAQGLTMSPDGNVARFLSEMDEKHPEFRQQYTDTFVGTITNDYAIFIPNRKICLDDFTRPTKVLEVVIGAKSFEKVNRLQLRGLLNLSSDENKILMSKYEDILFLIKDISILNLEDYFNILKDSTMFSAMEVKYNDELINVFRKTKFYGFKYPMVARGAISRYSTYKDEQGNSIAIKSYTNTKFEKNIVLGYNDLNNN